MPCDIQVLVLVLAVLVCVDSQKGLPRDVDFREWGQTRGLVSMFFIGCSHAFKNLFSAIATHAIVSLTLRDRLKL